MYYHHFGLSGPPFQFTPSADALYLSREHREALAFLEWSVLHEPTGFAVLVGESGVGKSTLICSVIARYCGTVETALINNPRLNFEQIILLALSQLGVAAGSSTKFELLQRFMRLLDERESSVAIFFDEAQELSDEVFGELRLLSHQGMAAAHNLRIVFVGQPELLERLSRPQLHALNQRIGARAKLSPMRTREVREYIQCQVQAKGARVPKVFAAGALQHLVGHSQGNPRRINVLCHNAMLTAYGAHRKRVDLASARNAVIEYENRSFQPSENSVAKKRTSLHGVRSLLLAMTSAAMLAAAAVVLMQRPNWVAGLFGARHTTVAIAPALRSDGKRPRLEQKLFAQPGAPTRAGGRNVAILPRVANEEGFAAEDRNQPSASRGRERDRNYSGENAERRAAENFVNE